MKPASDYFLVASRGLTATTWLAQALNMHPMIFCCHGRDRPERGPETKELLRSKRYREDRMHFERMQRGMTIEEYLETIENASGGQTCLGNVHGFVQVELIDKLQRAGLYGKIPIANMVRNPITFIASYTALVCHRIDDYPEKYEAEHLPRARTNRELVNTFSKSDITDVEMYGFVEACQGLVKMSDEIGVGHIPVIVMEKVVRERKYFVEIAEHLTQGKCVFDEDILERIFTRSKMNSHREKVEKNHVPGEAKASEESVRIWQSWSEAKKNLFKYIVREDHIQKFVSIGYDLSFLSSMRP